MGTDVIGSIRLFGDNILVKMGAGNFLQRGKERIIVPDTVKDRDKTMPCWGEVVSMGERVENLLELRPGDIVVFPPTSGFGIGKSGDDVYRVIQGSIIAGVLCAEKS